MAILRLMDSAKRFYNGCSELHSEDVTLQKFKSTFRDRFKDVHKDQCKALAQKIICKVDDPVAQRIHRETAECMLLASFVSGLMHPAHK